jgi:hypothetical protein
MIRAALALLLLAAPALADDAALRVQIARDPSVAAAAPALARFMEAEDDALVQEMQAAAETERADAAKGGLPFRPHSLDIAAQARGVSPALMSVLRTVSSDTGGAHGNVYLDPLTWDRRGGKLIRLDAILSEDKAGFRALEAIAKRLRADLMARPDLWRDSIAMATVPDPAALQGFTLEPSTTPGLIGGLAFHFGPYEVGPYSSGPQRAVIAQSLFRSGIRADLRDQFDGAPKD